jgi:TrmH family RNA methyltransferase
VPAVREIRSRQHPLVKEMRRALARGERTKDGLLALDTPHLVEEAVASGLDIAAILYSREQEPAVRRWRSRAGLYRASNEVLRAVGSTETSQGVLALVRPRAWLAHELFQPAPALVVILAGIQDPGNAGTILRSAEAFAATGAILLRGTVHAENAKLLRAAAGSTFRLPHLSGVELDQALATCRVHGATLYALDPRASQSLDQADLAQPCALAVGAEGRGLSPDLLEHAQPVAIPRVRRVESLNAAVAASLALAEAARHRDSRREARGAV